MTFGPIKDKPKQRLFSTYDLEWTPSHSPEKARAIGLEPLEVRLVGCYDGERYRGYRSIEDFLRSALTKRNHGRWYFAHAGGLYDVQFVLEWLIKNAPETFRISAALSASSAIIVKIERGKSCWYFVDSFWLLRTSLRKIGKWIGMEKGGQEGKTDVFWAPLGELLVYNEQDCRILWHAIAQLESIVLSLGGQLEKTAASTAMSLFRRAYLKREIVTSPAVNDLARSAYIASRVEPFERVAENAWSWDINSSFPYAMTFPAPGNLIGDDTRLPDSGLYVADVEVFQPPANIPVLPVRGARDGRVYFPTGRWRAWYSDTDCRFLEEAGGRVEKVHRVLHFEPFDDFSAYATDLYEKRRDSTDDGFKQISKILLNSLYGKTAEAGRKSQLWINPPREILALPDYVPGGTGKRFIRPGIWEVVEEREVPHAHVPIAMSITAIARRTLGRYLIAAPRVYYCDTDSLVVPRTHSYGDPNNPELGALKLEKPMVKAHFEAPKLYAWQGEDTDSWSVKAKGFSRILTENGDNRPLVGDDYWALVSGEAVKSSQFARVRELCSNPDPKPAEHVREKRLRGFLRPKRCFGTDGTSRPWTMSELDSPWSLSDPS